MFPCNSPTPVFRLRTEPLPTHVHIYRTNESTAFKISTAFESTTFYNAPLIHSHSHSHPHKHPRCRERWRNRESHCQNSKARFFFLCLNIPALSTLLTLSTCCRVCLCLSVRRLKRASLLRPIPFSLGKSAGSLGGVPRPLL